MLASKFEIKAAYPKLLLASLGMILTLRAFFPGIVTSDALDQYHQATTFIFGDWHPPVMSFIWAITNDWIPGPFGMLLLECFLYWGALLLISLSIPEQHNKTALFVIILGFMPFTIGTLSHIWKDVLHAVFWLFAVGVICNVIASAKIRYKKSMVFAAFMLLIGSMMRFNAIFGLLPLVWLLFNKVNMSKWKRIIVVLILFPLCTILLNATFNYGFLNAAKSRVYQSLIIFDLGGVSNYSKKDYFAEKWNDEEKFRVISSCYNSSAWDVYAWGECSFVLKKVQDSGSWTDGSLMKKWINAIYQEPGAYLKHRYDNFNHLMWSPNLILGDRTTENTLGFKYEKTGMFRTLEMMTNFLKDTLIFKPGFWLFASLLFLLYGLSARVCFARDVFLALNASSFLYLLAYFFVGVASDFRYSYWSILATTASLPFVLLYIKTKKE
jgi:hypothetical protein